MIGIILALIVSFLKSFSELAGKEYTNPDKTESLDEYSLAWGTRVFSLVILSPLVFFGIPELSEKMILILVVSALLGAVSTVTALKAVKHGDLSLVSPLSSLTLPFLFFTGYFIAGESPNIWGYIGVGVIFIGTYFLQIHELKKGFLAPLTSLSQNKGAQYMFLTAFLWSITSPLDKIGVVELGALNWMFVSNTSITGVLTIFLFFTQKSLGFTKTFQKKHIRKIAVLGLLGGAGVFLQMLATKYTLVIYVIALKRSSGMFSVFLGHIFYKEKHIKQKMFSAFLMILGVGVISIFGNI